MGERLPRDLCLAYVSDEAREQAGSKAQDRPELVELINGHNTSEDVARISGDRYRAMCFLVDLVEEGWIEAVEPTPQEGDAEEDWDFSL